MLLRILHHTQYRYAAPVLLAQHLAHLRPLNQPGQRVVLHHLLLQPNPAQRSASHDTFGNPREFFALQTPHDVLDVTADSLVATSPALAWPTASPAWESVRDSFVYRIGAVFDAASEFTFASPYVPHADAFANFARSAFAPGWPLLQACYALMDKIHTQLRYDSSSTEVNTPALQALQQRKGVCQDFAHIMLGCLRSLGLPARYVSGYLLTQPPPGQPRLVGADASHAWVAVYCAGQWYDFDPTNNRCGVGSPGEDYVTLATGRDFGDVSPLRGMIQGGGAHTLHVGG
ncbi:MAG: transglutaminase family protein, partial [Macromonas bipunctata]|nr:transglutaminase family protein [Macromonas bipunctata]